MCCVVVALVSAVALAEPAWTQEPTQSRVRVRVTDSSGVRIADADLAIIRGLHDTVALGLTEANGERGFVVARSVSPYQLIVRKIGFGRQQRFFMAQGDSAVVAVRLARLVQALAPVRVTEREDAVRKSYFIDADDIANSPRPLIDAGDILIKLRPDMIYSRGGRDACPSIANIWVNGVAVYREFRPGVAPRPSAANRSAAPAPMPPPYPISDMARERAKVPGSGASGIGAARLTALEGIKPEHVEQITYKDCFDTSVKGNFSRNALFIVLKLGIKYDLGIGSYAVEGGRTAR